MPKAGSASRPSAQIPDCTCPYQIFRPRRALFRLRQRHHFTYVILFVRNIQRFRGMKKNKNDHKHSSCLRPTFPPCVCPRILPKQAKQDFICPQLLYLQRVLDTVFKRRSQPRQVVTYDRLSPSLLARYTSARPTMAELLGGTQFFRIPVLFDFGSAGGTGKVTVFC